MQGKWVIESSKSELPFFDALLTGVALTIDGDSMVISAKPGVDGWKKTIKSESRTDNLIALRMVDRDGRVTLGICQVQEMTVRLCFTDRPGNPRPTKFEGGNKTGWTLWVLKRPNAKSPDAPRKDG
jgi:hypothetical protein